MYITALALYLVWTALAFGQRIIEQRRRTGCRAGSTKRHRATTVHRPRHNSR